MLGRTKGFTVIEVLLVLSVAGLIFAVVFLAVPALQRNSRNNARKHDARLLFASVNECLATNYYDFNKCNELSELPLDISKFSIYTGAHFGAGCINWLATPPPPAADRLLPP